MIQTTIEVRTASWLEGARPLGQRRGCGSDWGMAGKIRENDEENALFGVFKNVWAPKLGLPFTHQKFTENLLLADEKQTQPKNPMSHLTAAKKVKPLPSLQNKGAAAAKQAPKPKSPAGTLLGFHFI